LQAPAYGRAHLGAWLGGRVSGLVLPQCKSQKLNKTNTKAAKKWLKAFSQ